MGLLGKIWVKLGLDNSEFKQELKESQGKAGQFKNFIKGVGSGLLAAFSVTAIIRFGKAAVTAYNEQAQAIAKLDSVIRSTGGAVGVTSKELQNYASQLQKATMYGDEVTLNAMAIGATFKSIKGDIFKGMIASAQDLATVLGTDLNGAVMKLGKALENPEIGLTMLRRSGISFSTQQIEQIKQLVAEGKKHEAQVVILTEVQNKFGGAAKAAADTAKGAWVQLGNSFGDLMETIGSGTEKTKGFAGSLKIWVEQLDRLFKSQDVGFWGKLTGLFGGNQAAFRKANEEAERNLRYNQEAEKQAEAAMSVVTDLAEAERQLQILGKGTGVLWRELFEQKLKTYIQSAKNAELQAQLDEEEAEAARKKAAAEEAARIAEEKHIEGSLKNLQYVIKLKQEEITLTTDESKRAALNQELANLEHRLAVMKLTTDELRDYNALITRGKTPLPSVVNNIQGKAVVQGQVDPITGMKTQSDDTLDGLRDFNDDLQGEVERSADISALFGQAVARSFSDSMRVIFDAIASGEKIDSSDLAKAILMPFADMAVQIGEVLIASGVGALAAKTLIKNPYTAIAAGAALIVIGTAAQAAIGSIGANLGGKSGGGNNTYGTTGGGMGSPSWQPTSSMNMNINLTGVLKGQDLYLAIEKTKANKNR